jgi:hypothetical protein
VVDVARKESDGARNFDALTGRELAWLAIAVEVEAIGRVESFRSPSRWSDRQDVVAGEAAEHVASAVASRNAVSRRSRKRDPRASREGRTRAFAAWSPGTWS